VAADVKLITVSANMRKALNPAWARRLCESIGQFMLRDIVGRSWPDPQDVALIAAVQLKLWLVMSDTAEQIAVRPRRPLDDPRAITVDDKWAQVARPLSYQPEKDNALSMFDRVSNIRRGAVRALHDLVPPNVAQQVSRSGPTRAHEVARSYRQERSLWRRAQGDHGAGYRQGPTDPASSDPLASGERL
jgi:hypothetical protein